MTDRGLAPVVPDRTEVLSTDTQRIGIVGAGRLGQALSRRAAAAGVEVIICNSRDPATLAGFVRDAGPGIAAATIAEATSPEIVVLAVPWQRLDAVFETVPDWEGRIVVDATNPIVAGEVAALGERTSSEVVADGLPGAHLVKAFNTLPAPLLAVTPRRRAGRRVTFVAGDHQRSKGDVLRLVEQLGFAAIDLGPLRCGGALMQYPGGSLAALDLLRIDAKA